MWLPRCPHLKFDDGDYEQKNDTEPESTGRRKTARRRVNPFIDAETGVDWDASNDEGFDNDNDDSNEFIVVDDIEF